MKIAVVGSRDFKNYELLSNSLNTQAPISKIITGGAKGADSLAEKYAIENNIAFEVFLPDWKRFQKAAGIRRNKKIVEAAEKIIAFWDGKSKGTQFTINYAKELNKEVVIVSF